MARRQFEDDAAKVFRGILILVYGFLFLLAGTLIVPGILPTYFLYWLSCGGGGESAGWGRCSRSEDRGFLFGDSVKACSDEVREYQHMERNNPNALPLDGVYLAKLSIAGPKSSFKLKLKFAFKEKGWEIYSQTEPFLSEESMQRSQGFVNLQGDAYWVTHLDPWNDNTNLLLRGNFNFEQEQNEFVGEYLSKDGKRGKVTSIKYTSEVILPEARALDVELAPSSSWSGDAYPMAVATLAPGQEKEEMTPLRSREVVCL